MAVLRTNLNHVYLNCASTHSEISQRHHARRSTVCPCICSINYNGAAIFPVYPGLSPLPSGAPRSFHVYLTFVCYPRPQNRMTRGQAFGITAFAHQYNCLSNRVQQKGVLPCCPIL